jgi:predicted nucleic acid-binding Zn ribbon protein
MSNIIRGPQSLSDILGELIVVRGYSRAHAGQVLENAWNTVVGEPYCHLTQVGEVRHGVLNVTVVHSSLLEELMFRKTRLVAFLRSGGLGTAIDDIRFRVGTVAFAFQDMIE